MKKIICFLIAISAIVCLLVGCDLGDTDVTTGGDNGNATPDSTTGTQETEASTQDSKLGKYNVVIDSVRIAEDYSGEPIVIVKYIFTNNNNLIIILLLGKNKGIFFSKFSQNDLIRSLADGIQDLPWLKKEFMLYSN